MLLALAYESTTVEATLSPDRVDSRIAQRLCSRTKKC